MLISVVIPMYNSSNTIIRSLQSVLNQNFMECKYEVLIINDGSKDNSVTLVEEFICNNDDKENYEFKLINQENGGVSKARNTGLKNCTGEFIAFLDSDDEWHIDKIAQQLPFLLDTSVDFVTSLRNTDIISFPYKLSHNSEYAKITLRKLLIKVVGQTSTAIFKRHIIENIGYFDENQRYSEDANLWMRIAIKYNMIILNKVLVTTGGGKPSVGHSGLSANIKGMEDGVQKNINEMRDIGGIDYKEYIFFKLFSRVKYIIRKIRY